MSIAAAIRVSRSAATSSEHIAQMPRLSQRDLLAAAFGVSCCDSVLAMLSDSMASQQVVGGLLLGLFACYAPSTAAAAQGGAATYQLCFDSTWSALTHPQSFPLSAQFSQLVGGTHDAATSFWQVGGQASPGLEMVAGAGRYRGIHQ